MSFFVLWLGSALWTFETIDDVDIGARGSFLEL